MGSRVLQLHGQFKIKFRKPLSCSNGGEFLPPKLSFSSLRIELKGKREAAPTNHLKILNARVCIIFLRAFAAKHLYTHDYILVHNKVTLKNFHFHRLTYSLVVISQSQIWHRSRGIKGAYSVDHLSKSAATQTYLRPSIQPSIHSPTHHLIIPGGERLPRDTRRHTKARSLENEKARELQIAQNCFDESSSGQFFFSSKLNWSPAACPMGPEWSRQEKPPFLCWVKPLFLDSFQS